MKRSILTAGCALAAALSFAVPSPRWVPASADLVAVGENAEGKNAEAESAWKKAFKEAGVELPEDTSFAVGQLEEVSPHLPAILKAMGASGDLKAFAPYSVVYAVSLPKRAEAMKGGSFAKEASLHVIYESAALDLPALDKAVAAFCAEKRETVTVTFRRSGEWRTLAFEPKEKDADMPALPFFGYRPVKGGLAIALCADQATAEAWATGKTPAIAKDSPLMEAFTPIAGAQSWGRMRLADLAGLIGRLTDAEARKALAAKVPLLQKIHKVGVDTAYKGADGIFSLAFEADDEASATQLRDLLLGWKGLLSQMMLPMLTQKPDSATAALANGIVCEAKGKCVSLRLTVTPTLGAKAIKEFQEIAARQAAQAATLNPPDDEDEDEDVEPMSEEEARKILQGLEAK